MRKVSQQKIRQYLSMPGAIDCTNHCVSDRRAVIAREGWLDTVAYSAGSVGCNGVVVQGHNTGAYYVVPSRCSATFIYL